MKREEIIKKYCQGMISNTGNYTMAYLAERLGISHDKLRAILMTTKIPLEEVEKRGNKNCKKLIIDDTVLDKRYSSKIEIAKHLWDNCEKRVIECIGLVSAISVAEDGNCDLVSYRLYDKANDNKTKNDHFRDMLIESEADEIYFDCWYANRENLELINKLGKKFYCGISTNRIVFDAGGNKKPLSEVEDGELVNLKNLKFKVRIFIKTGKDGRRYYLATNDLELTDNDFFQKYSIRWKIEDYHREIKQITGIERCQARLTQIQKNHIACCLMAWQFLKKKAYILKETVYQLYKSQINNFISQQLFSPILKFS